MTASGSVNQVYRLASEKRDYVFSCRSKHHLAAYSSPTDHLAFKYRDKPFDPLTPTPTATPKTLKRHDVGCAMDQDRRTAVCEW